MHKGGIAEETSTMRDVSQYCLLGKMKKIKRLQSSFVVWTKPPLQRFTCNSNRIVDFSSKTMAVRRRCSRKERESDILYKWTDLR